MIAARPALLIVGGLTIDRLADRSTVPGGSVLHGARALFASGHRVATITAAGPEPEVAAAVAELAAMGPSLAWPVHATIRYAIREDGNHRSLVLEQMGRTIPLSATDVAATGAAAVLFAPIAAEVSVQAIGSCASVPVRVAALQGWLRRLIPGDEVDPLPLEALAADLTTVLGELDALVASHDDLAAVSANPQEQLRALRAHVGGRPLLVVTTGAEGAWLDDPVGGTHQLPATRRLAGISSVGAGDAFAALLAVAMASGLGSMEAVRAATVATASHLATLPS